MVNYEYPPLGGGGGVAQRDLAQALARRHDIAVLTTHYRGLPLQETSGGIVVRRLRVWGRTALATATLRSMLSFPPVACTAGHAFARAFAPDVISAFFAVPSGLPAAFLGRVLRVPVVLTLVGGDIFDPDPTAGIATHRNPFVRVVIRRVIRAADARVAISRDTKERAARYHEAPNDIDVIPLGLVPPSQPLPPGRSLAHQTTAGMAWPFRFIAVGRLIPRKAHTDLLQAFADLRERDARLDLVGDGPLESSLRATAARLGIAKRVTFHGRVAEERKWELLSEADCFVSASLYEGFGVMFLEAMYAGVPMIATDEGGQMDFLVQGETALLVPPRQPVQLAAAMRWVIRDQVLRERLSAEGRTRVRGLLIDETAARYEALFERLVSQRRARSPALSNRPAERPMRP